MIKLLVSEIDLDELINSYSEIDKTFIFINKSKNAQKWNYKFYIDRKLCSLDAYIVKDGIRFVPTSKNIDSCNKLINYLKEKCVDSDIPSVTKTIECDNSVVKKAVADLLDSNIAKKECEKDNHVKLQGYNGDIVNLNIYENKLVIQARPLCVYGALLSSLSLYVNIDFKDEGITNKVVNLHDNLLDRTISNRIGSCYLYLDEALRDSLKSSYELLKVYEINSITLSDYSGILVGSFKALEGYLRKVLVEKYHYRFEKGKSFDMFKAVNGTSNIDQNPMINDESKRQLKNLYRIFNQKRNVYLHGSNTSTVIIKNYIDAKSIFDEILDSLDNAYSIINK